MERKTIEPKIKIFSCFSCFECEELSISS